MSGTKTQRDRTVSRTVVAALCMLVIGILMLVSSEAWDCITSRAWLKAIVSNLGGLVIASVSIALLWELFSKRAFFDEMLNRIKLVDDVNDLGLLRATLEPTHDPDFPSLFRSTLTLDVFVAYAATWRGNNETHIRELVARRGAKVRVVLPNFQNVLLVEQLAARFGGTAADIESKIRNAVNEFQDIFERSKNVSGQFEIWLHDLTPVESFFLFDQAGVVTFYKQSKGRSGAMTLVAERGGALYRYLREEVTYFVGDEVQTASAKKIYPTSGA